MRQSVPGNAQEQPRAGLASESSDDLEVVEEKIVKKYEGAEAGASGVIIKALLYFLVDGSMNGKMPTP